MTFDFKTQYAEKMNTMYVQVIDTANDQVLYTGHALQIVKLLNMSLMKVCGYAEWGRPAKKLKKLGYYLRWTNK